MAVGLTKKSSSGQERLEEGNLARGSAGAGTPEMAGDAGTASDPDGGSPSLKMVAPADFKRREGAPGADCEEARGRGARV